MQKKLLGLAVAGALAAPGAALAQVEVYGFISVAAQKFKYSDVGTTPSVSKWDVSSHGSNYGVRGRENIGGGQTAWFQIEQNAPMERSNNIAITPASRNTAVGLQGAWGNFFIGQWTTPWADLESLWSIGAVGGYSPSLSIIGRRETTGSAPNWNCANGHDSGVATGFPANGNAGGAANNLGPLQFAGSSHLEGFQPFCDAVEGGGGVGHPFWRRISQSVFYYSPVFAGAQLKLAYQTNEGKATAGALGINADPSMWSGAVQWSGMGGRARVGAAYDAHKDFTTVGQTDKGWTVKGGFNFGFVDVGVAYEKMTYKCGPVTTAVGIPANAIFPGSLAVPAGSTVTTSCGGGTNLSTGAAVAQINGDVDAEQWGIAVAVPIGQGAIRASYAVAEDLEFPTGTTDSGAKFWTIGYDYRFSKRTQVGVGYAVIKNDPAAIFTWTGAPPSQGGASNNPPAGSDPSTFFLSIVHRF